MKFAHFSDVHLGSWSASPELRNFSLQAFEKAISTCIAQGVEFIIIAGDLFDAPLPPYDILSGSTSILRKCREEGIRIYVVPGSHDYSPSDKTFITVLENAGLLVNVSKFTEEAGKIKLRFVADKCGAKITGFMGKAGSLETEYFRILDKEALEKEEGLKIFVFHSAIEEFTAGHLRGMASVPFSMFPRGFYYYAGGHIHNTFRNGNVVFPGVLFPTETSELENYNSGVYVVDTEAKDIKKIPVKMFDVATLSLDADGKTVVETEKEILEMINGSDIQGKLLIIKVTGTLNAGAPSDINFSLLKERAEEKGAFSVKKNFARLNSQDFEESEEASSLSVEEIEHSVIDENCGKHKITFAPVEAELVKNMMYALNDEKQEGETVSAFEERVKDNATRVLGL